MSAAPQKDLANAIRALSMDAVQQANSGHPGMPMGMADVATVLFTKFLKFDPKAPNWPDRDRFVLSAGHGSMLQYSLMYLTGYEDITLDEIKNFRQLNARTAGHPEFGHAAGIETTTGPLGQGIGNGVGMALAERILNARFGDEAVDHYTYVIAGDGCLMEGISHEAISMAGHLKLDRLIVLFDDNGITIDGSTDIAVSDDQLARFKASNWDVVAIDGHDPEAIEAAIAAAKETDKPSLIACKTTIGYGSPSKGGKSSSHGAPLGDDEIKVTKEALGWNYGPFEIPENVLETWRAAGRCGLAAHETWYERMENMDAEKRADFERGQKGELKAGWKEALNAFKKQTSEEQTKVATRKSSELTLNVLAEALPELLGGSADLTGSNNTKAKSMEPIQAGAYENSYIYYGVREHGMAAAMNGIALHGGLIPYGATFLVFTDYCRPSIRLSALMGIRVGYVMTHDSIGLGEDGPTHQPVEHVASLRLIPNLNVFRPCDTVETAEAWAMTLESENTPSVLALTRQGLPIVRTEHTEENLTAKGGYILRAAEGGERKVTLMATGSEVEIAMNARDALQAEGIPTAVVSMPCMELFDAQDMDYRLSVLGEGSVRVAVEAGLRESWDKYLGMKGAFIGMTGFGASAPIEDLYNHFGITPEAVAQAAKDGLDA